MRWGRWLAHAHLRSGSGTRTLDVKDPGAPDPWAQTMTQGQPQHSFSPAAPRPHPTPRGLLPHVSLPHIQGIQIAVTVTNERERVGGALLEHFASLTFTQTRTCCGPHFTEEETEAEGSGVAGQGHTVVSSKHGGVMASRPHACTPQDHAAYSASRCGKTRSLVGKPRPCSEPQVGTATCPCSQSVPRIKPGVFASTTTGFSGDQGRERGEGVSPADQGSGGPGPFCGSAGLIPPPG